MRYSEKAAPAPGGEPDEFVMSDGSVDRMGDVIEPSGWDLTAIKSDPVVLFNHDRGQVVGSWKDIRVKDGKLIGRINWTKSKEWPMGNYIRDLVREGILRTVSVGFKPHEKRPLTKDASPEYGPFRFTKQSLLECSLVSVPANANALAIAKDYPRGLLDEVFRKPASEHLDRSAAPHGKSAASPIEQQKGSKMSNAATIANKIQSAQQSLNGLLASYEELAGRSEMGEDETKRYRDELPAQIDAAKAELESHKRAERILLGGQTASDPMPAALTGQIMAPTPAKSDQSIGEVVRIPAVPKKKLEPSDHHPQPLGAGCTQLTS